MTQGELMNLRELEARFGAMVDAQNSSFDERLAIVVTYVAALAREARPTVEVIEVEASDQGAYISLSEDADEWGDYDSWDEANSALSWISFAMADAGVCPGWDAVDRKRGYYQILVEQALAAIAQQKPEAPKVAPADAAEIAAFAHTYWRERTDLTRLGDEAGESGDYREYEEALDHFHTNIDSWTDTLLEALGHGEGSPAAKPWRKYLKKKERSA